MIFFETNRCNLELKISSEYIENVLGINKI